MLSICIINWNVSDLLDKCLSSIYRFPPNSEFEVIVVDNASYDDSVSMVTAKFPQVKLIANKINSGFSMANNQAIRQSKGEYLLVLNPDTENIEGSLGLLINFLQAHTDAGAVAPKLLNSGGSLQRSCMGFPTIGAMAARQLFIELIWPNNPFSKKYLMSEFKYDKISEVDQPMGACILFRKKTLDKVGLFDEKSFMFFDEVDLCFRIKKSGWRIFFIPDAQIMHRGGSSIKKWGFLSLSRNWTKSRNLFFKKYYGQPVLMALYVIDAVRIFLIFILLWVIYKLLFIFL